MSHCSLLRYIYLAYLSKPRADRAVYRLLRRQRLRRQPIRSIVELGMGTGDRAVRMIRVATSGVSEGPIRYTGVDLFEMRSGQVPALSLKQAHRLLSGTGCKPQLVPGDPLTALSRVANTLTGTDLLIVGPEQEPHSMSRAWFYVPRMLHPGSQVLEGRLAGDATMHWQPVTREEVERRAAAASRAQRAAA